VPAPFGVELFAIPGDARAFFDDRGPATDDPIDQGRLAHVGPTGDDH
jgi:hypothetical protein